MSIRGEKGRRENEKSKTKDDKEVDEKEGEKRMKR